MKMIVEPAAVDEKMATCSAVSTTCRHKCKVYK